jgi:hypothetical protein
MDKEMHTISLRLIIYGGRLCGRKRTRKKKRGEMAV